MIQDHVNKYMNSLSTNKMKFDELILKKVHINLKILTIHTTMILIVVDFNLHGLNHIGIGWNTHLQWMRYIRHVGKDPNSPHKIVEKCCENLKNYLRHAN